MMLGESSKQRQDRAEAVMSDALGEVVGDGAPDEDALISAIRNSTPSPREYGDRPRGLAAVPGAISSGVRSAISSARELVAWAAPRAKHALHTSSLIIAQLTAPPAPPPRGVKSRDWQVDTKLSGKKGEVLEAVIAPECLFRGEKIMASDTREGRGTRVGAIAIGQRLQRPAGSGATLTLFLSQQALGNGGRLDNCRPWEKIRIQVHFIEDCDWDCTIFGKAVLTPSDYQTMEPA